MANYYATIRTNYFSVKDEAAFRELIQSVIAEDEVYIFEEPQSDGSKKFGFGCYGTISGIYVDSDDDRFEPDIDDFWNALQKLVCEDDAIIITELGSEKLRYLVGGSTVITSESIQFVDVWKESLEIARQLLNNPNYQTDFDY